MSYSFVRVDSDWLVRSVLLALSHSRTLALSHSRTLNVDRRLADP